MGQVSLQRRLMGGTFGVLAFTNGANVSDRVEKIIEEAFDAIQQLEDKLTDFKPSQFNQINANAGQSPVAVDEETFSLIQKAQSISHQTEGAFDISYASVGRFWRQARQENVLPSMSQIEHHKQFVNFRLIQMDEKSKTVFLPYPEMRIGLGGIGKGYAVDKLYEYLRSHGVTNFLVDGSGDIRVHSTDDAPRPWRLHVRNPFSEDQKKAIGILHLKNGALATSGDYVNYIKATKGMERRYHHIIDPLLGTPTNEIVSCTVVADDAVTADTTATSVIVMNRERGINFLNQQDLLGFVVLKDGSVHLSKKAYQLMAKEVTCLNSSSV